MQSFLIISTDKKATDLYATKLLEKHVISPFDITTVETEKSIGIEEVRLLQKKIYLTPLKGALKAIVIKNAQTLTPEAQNALLKLLEEPPRHTLILLLSQSKEQMLTTVCSRCTIYDLTNEEKKIPAPDTEYESLFVSLPRLSLGKKLQLAQQLAGTKEQALQMLVQLLEAGESVLHTQIKNDSAYTSSLQTLNTLQNGYTRIKTTNANPRLLVENLLVNDII